MEGKIVTLKDIAREAGVHPSTVSLCLNDSGAVAEATRERVRRIARELQYHPHPHLKALMRSRRRREMAPTPSSLGFVRFDSEGDGMGKELDAPMRRLRDAAARKAEMFGFRLEEFVVPLESVSGGEVEALFRSREIAGAILSPLPEIRERLDWPWEELAAVAIGTNLREPGVHRVRSSHFRSLAVAMKQCFAMGYRRAGLALRIDHRTDFRWLASYLAVGEGMDSRDRVEPFCSEDWRAEPFLEWVAREKPEVILASSGEEVLRWLTKAGFAVPERMGLVSLSLGSKRSRISGIYENWEFQGERAVMVLADLLIDNEFGLQKSPVISVVEGSWNLGKTVQTRRQQSV